MNDIPLNYTRAQEFLDGMGGLKSDKLGKKELEVLNIIQGKTRSVFSNLFAKKTESSYSNLKPLVEYIVRSVETQIKEPNFPLKEEIKKIHKAVEALGYLQAEEVGREKLQNVKDISLSMNILGAYSEKLESLVEHKELERKNKEIEAKQKKVTTLTKSAENEIPELVQDTKDMIPKEEMLEKLKNRMIADYPKPSDVNVPQFVRDMVGLMTFCIKDPYNAINDETQQPPLDLPKEKRIEKGISMIHEVCKNEKDRKWEIALQLIANQTSLNIIFAGPKGFFNMAHADSFKDPVDNKNLVLSLELSNSIPINLTIIRNPITNEIDHVDVEVKGFMDLTSVEESSQKLRGVLIPKVIEGKLNYTVKMDENNRPIILNFDAGITSQIKK